MVERTIYVNVSSGRVSSAADGTGAVVLSARLRTILTLHVVLVNDAGEVQDATLSSEEGGGMLLAVKAPGQYSGAPLLLNTDETKSGTGTTAKWSFNTVIDSAVLLAAIDAGSPDAASLDTELEVQWTVDGESAPRRSARLKFAIGTAVYRTEDESPDPSADASWTWLKSRIVAGAGVTLTVDDDARTITVKAGYATASGLFIEFYDKDGALVGKSPRVATS